MDLGEDRRAGELRGPEGVGKELKQSSSQGARTWPRRGVGHRAGHGRHAARRPSRAGAGPAARITSKRPDGHCARCGRVDAALDAGIARPRDAVAQLERRRRALRLLAPAGTSEKARNVGGPSRGTDSCRGDGPGERWALTISRFRCLRCSQTPQPPSTTSRGVGEGRQASSVGAASTTTTFVETIGARLLASVAARQKRATPRSRRPRATASRRRRVIELCLMS